MEMQHPTARLIPVKITYTFDNDVTTCISRSSTAQEIRVVCRPEKDPLGVIDIALCIQCLSESSPEIISNMASCDYAVYSVDYSEPDLPLVGHGMFSWIYLDSCDKPPPGRSPAPATLKEKLMARNKGPPDDLPDIAAARLAVGKISTSILSLFSGSSRETLEVRIKLVPVDNFSQEQYTQSLNIYKALCKILPKNFDHPSWVNFVSQNNLLERYLASPRTDLEDSGFQTVAGEHSRSTGRMRRSISARSTNKRAIIQNSAVNNEDPSAQTAKRQRSESPSPLTEPSFRMSELTPNVPNSLGPPSSNFHFSEPATSPLISSNLIETDTTLYASSPVSQLSFSKQSYPPIPAYEPSRSLVEGVNSPSISCQTPFNEPATSKQASTPIAVQARGSRRKLAVKDEWRFCENCGQIETPAWRKITGTLNGVEKEFILCNPCGIWFQTKHTMRPKDRWGRDNASSALSSAISSATPITLANAAATMLPETPNDSADKESIQSKPKKRVKKTRKREPADSEPQLTNIAEALAANAERKRRSNNDDQSDITPETDQAGPRNVESNSNSDGQEQNDGDEGSGGVSEPKFISIAPKAKEPATLPTKRARKSASTTTESPAGVSPSDSAEATQTKRPRRKYTRKTPLPKVDEASNKPLKASKAIPPKSTAPSSPVAQPEEPFPKPSTPKRGGREQPDDAFPERLTTPKRLPKSSLVSPNISPSAWISQLFSSPGNKRSQRISPLPSLTEYSELDRQFSEPAFDPSVADFDHGINFEELAREMGITADLVGGDVLDTSKIDSLVPFFEMTMQAEKTLPFLEAKPKQIGGTNSQKDDEKEAESSDCATEAKEETMLLPPPRSFRTKLANPNEQDQISLEAPRSKEMTLPSSPPRSYYNNIDDWSDAE